MAETIIKLTFDDYRPDDASELCFKRKGGGWLSQSDLEERLISKVRLAIGIMDYGDHLIVTMQVKTPEDE